VGLFYRIALQRSSCIVIRAILPGRPRRRATFAGGA
jgi:hypothetical protein